MLRATSQHPRARVAPFAWAALSLLLVGLLETAGLSAYPALARSAGDPLSTYQLLPHYSARLEADGTWQALAGPEGEAFLTVRITGLLDGPRGRRRGLEPSVLAAQLDERSVGGARGFSSDADDDQDGLVDEDRHDGLDNDGDGLVDEDFAAVSDHMTVVHRQLGSRHVHQESYRWTVPGLRATTFLKLDTDVPDGVALEVAGPRGQWVTAQVTAFVHLATGKTRHDELQPFVMRVPAPGAGATAGAGSWLWLGVQVLERPDGWRARTEGADGRLLLPVSDEALVVALTVAPSWPRLAHQLGMARVLHEGVVDPVSGRRARWIVPAACSLCRTASAPAVAVTSDGEQGLVLGLDLEPGISGLVDCDLLSLDGEPLGPPARLVWLPEEGEARTMDWQEVTPRTLLNRGGFAGHPFALLDDPAGGPAVHDARGTLQLRFATSPLDGKPASGVLSGFWLDGRAFRCEIQPPGRPAFEPLGASSAQETAGGMGEGAAQDPADPEATSRRLEQAAHAPTLAPSLLEGWPNPFRDVIQVRFKVPLTVGEAFVWVEEEDVPANLDKDAATPWQGSGAGCTVKIYNINGQELVTLYDGVVISGEFTVSWNGSDEYGRQVASGTYFCKLQLDEWSVTRRIVYLR